MPTRTSSWRSRRRLAGCSPRQTTASASRERGAGSASSTVFAGSSGWRSRPARRRSFTRSAPPTVERKAGSSTVCVVLSSTGRCRHRPRSSAARSFSRVRERSRPSKLPSSARSRGSSRCEGDFDEARQPLQAGEAALGGARSPLRRRRPDAGRGRDRAARTRSRRGGARAANRRRDPGGSRRQRAPVRAARQGTGRTGGGGGGRGAGARGRGRGGWARDPGRGHRGCDQGVRRRAARRPRRCGAHRSRPPSRAPSGRMRRTSAAMPWSCSRPASRSSGGATSRPPGRRSARELYASKGNLAGLERLDG